jgi:hypothetical protein
MLSRRLSMEWSKKGIGSHNTIGKNISHNYVLRCHLWEPNDRLGIGMPSRHQGQQTKRDPSPIKLKAASSCTKINKLFEFHHIYRQARTQRKR